MAETLGKRISCNRKRLGMTQDQLAEKLGVTAQAVSKWENDQSCPDIQILPRLAGIFSITTDALLGAEPVKKQPVLEAETVEKADDRAQEPANGKVPMGSGKRFLLGLALWLLLAGGLLLIEPRVPAAPWTLLWTSALTVFGLLGLYPRFSVFRLGCAVVGGGAIALSICSTALNAPMVMILLGLLVLLEAVWGRKKSAAVPTSGSTPVPGDCCMEGESFRCSASFGEKHCRIDLPRLSSGCASLSFGELELDLTGCGEIADGCRIEIHSSFGETRLVVPSGCVVRSEVKSSFGDTRFRGQPAPGAGTVLHLTGSVAFGELEVSYRS